MRRALLAVIVGTYLVATGAHAQEQAAKTSLYPAADAAKDIGAAFSAASKDGKNVLLDFGADWCPDCRVLGALFEDASVTPFVDANFHVVRIDVGRRDKNGDLATKYGATSGDWIPAVVVLDPRQHAIAATDTTVRLTRKTSAAELLALLKQWAPKKVIASLGSFSQGGVHVEVTLQRDVARQTWIAATFAPERADAHLYAKDLPARGVDGLGRPTRLSVVSATGLKVVGDLVADRRVHEDVIEELHLSLPVYPNGPVTLRLPVVVNRGAQAELSLGYMACGSIGCLPPVTDKRLRITLSAVTP
jgi:thiol-disulfide isomerase/thioredoxin